jgi:hypothetical protein
MYVVCDALRLVYVFWVYTHAEFSEPNARPPAKELKHEILLVKDNAEQRSNDASKEAVSVITVEGGQAESV